MRKRNGVKKRAGGRRQGQRATEDRSDREETGGGEGYFRLRKGGCTREEKSNLT